MVQEELRVKYEKEHLPKWLKMFDTQLGKSETGKYFVGHKVCYITSHMFKT